jgi:hypothetical protein
MRVILDDDEVSSDEDEPLQKQLRQLSSAGLAVLDEAAAADKEAVDKRAAKEATTKRAAEERAVEEVMANAGAAEEVMANAGAAEEVAGKTADEATGAAGGSGAPGQCHTPKF